MDLKSILPTKVKLTKEYYWAVTLEPDWVQAAIWEVKDGMVKTKASSPPSSWGGEEDLVAAVDNALSSIVQNLPEDAKEPQKCVFGLPSSWIIKGEIKKEYLDKLKKLCSDLSLEPSGFVVLPEAIAYYLKTKEGAPLTAIVLGVSAENIEISIFKLGKPIGTTNVARSVSISDDVTEGLSRFAGSKAFPSRFILYDGKEKELEEVKQSLLKSQWDDSGKVKFLHTPKAEVINVDDKITAVSLAGGAEIAGASTIFSKDEKKDRDEEIVAPEAAKGVADTKPEDVGFVIGKDVATPDSKDKADEPKGSDSTTSSTESTSTARGVKDQVPTAGGPKGINLSSKISGFYATFANMLKLKRKDKPQKAPSTGGRDVKKTAMFLGLSVLALFVVGFIAWWYLPKAIVTVFIVPRDLKEVLAINIDTKGETPNYSEKLLPGNVNTFQVSGEETIQATGTKTVGERSKGTVTIQNGTSASINLPAGTILIAGNDLQFTLDSSASVSAAISPSSPGTVNIEATADDIGAEYNLAKDESFKVGNYPKADVDAVATSDFSGGSSRQISAVSAEDQDDLLASLTQDLETKARDEITVNMSADAYLLQGSETSDIITRNFSSKVGDEASNISLALELEVGVITVKKEDLINLANEILENKIPSGFVLREEQLLVEFDFDEEENGLYKFTAEMTANLLPEVDPDSLAKSIAGKYPSLAQDYLTSIPGFSRAEIRLKPSLPGRLGSLPRVINNIEIEVAAEK